MEKGIFCPCVLESLYESVLLIVDSELLNALWLWPGTMSRKALPPPFGAGISPIQAIRWRGLWLKMTENTTQNGLNIKNMHYLM